MNWLLWRAAWREAGTLWGQLVQQREAGLASGLWCKARVVDNKVKILEFGDRPEPWREKEGQTQSRVLTWVMRVGREEREIEDSGGGGEIMRHLPVPQL